MLFSDVSHRDSRSSSTDEAQVTVDYRALSHTINPVHMELMNNEKVLVVSGSRQPLTRVEPVNRGFDAKDGAQYNQRRCQA